LKKEQVPGEKRLFQEQVPQGPRQAEEKAEEEEERSSGENGCFGHLLNQLVMIRHQNLTTSLSE
jgi:hypothetical protein